LVARFNRSNGLSVLKNVNMNFRDGIKKIGYDFGITKTKDEECLDKIELLVLNHIKVAGFEIYFETMFGEYVWMNLSRNEKDKIIIKTFNNPIFTNDLD